MKSVQHNDALVAEARASVTAYLDALNKTAFAGTLEEQVYHLLGDEEFEMNPFSYNMALSVFFRKLATNSKLVQALKEELGGLFDTAMEAMGNLMEFTAIMQNENFEVQLLLHQLKSYSSEWSDVDLQRTIETYKIKLRGVVDHSEINARIPKAA